MLTYYMFQKKHVTHNFYCKLYTGAILRMKASKKCILEVSSIHLLTTTLSFILFLEFSSVDSFSNHKTKPVWVPLWFPLPGFKLQCLFFLCLNPFSSSCFSKQGVHLAVVPTLLLPSRPSLFKEGESTLVNAKLDTQILTLHISQFMKIFSCLSLLAINSWRVFLKTVKHILS